jgi:chromosomal replication initiation ATPase DnaA
MRGQLSFELPFRPALGRGDFFVSSANAEAVTLIETWENWPHAKLILTGPPGAGKTHLTHVWAALCGALIVAARDLGAADIAGLAARPVAVEDADRISGDPAAEEALFHLHNLTLAEGNPLLLTGRVVPGLWGLHLPDLASRMQGTLVAHLRAPDDALLAAVLTKLFADRQISPTPDTVPYLARRIERSFDTARRVVTALDNKALAEGRPVSRALAAEVLDKLRD